MPTEEKIRQEVVRVCRMLHRKNYLAATDGNVSVRLGDRLLVTPSGINKGLMEPEQLITVSLDGKVLAGEGRPTSEIRMHLLAYELRPDVGAVVHAHLPYATACTLAGIDLLEPILPEVVITLGGIPTAPYATPGSAEVPEAVRDFLREYDAILLSRHGAMTVGQDVMDAYNKMEKLEHTARVVLAARLQGALPPMPPAEVEKLRRLGAKYKGGGRFHGMSRLSEEGEQLFKEFNEKTKKHLISCVIGNKNRFPDGERLLARYQDAVSRVLTEGIPRLRDFHEAHNELCTATVILEDKSESKVIKLQYEPAIDGCDKRFDFHATMSEGPIRYIEVKTIHPTTQDDWYKYQCAMKSKRFPEDTYLILEKEWLGGELYHNAYAARSKMLDYTLDMENKVEACISNIGEKLTFLALFSNGFHWHLAELENFVFFYRKGVHFPGDPFARMEEFAVGQRNIQFRRSIDHFAYFRRPKTEIKPNKVVWSVTTPQMPY